MQFTVPVEENESSDDENDYDGELGSNPFGSDPGSDDFDAPELDEFGLENDEDDSDAPETVHTKKNKLAK